MKRKIVIAVDKYKGTLSTSEAADALARAIGRCADCDVDVVLCPMADGGEGTAEIAYGLFERTIVLESCSVLSRGYGNFAGVAPMQTGSYELGRLIAMKLTACNEVVHVGVGGTSTCDGGAGMLQAIGATYYDKDGCLIERQVTAGDLYKIERVDLSAIDFRKVKCRLRVHCDVDVPLVGDKELSSLSFASQKGFTSEEIKYLKRELARWRDMTLSALGVEEGRFGGAGGGLGYAFSTLLGVSCDYGAEWLAGSYDFSDADIVITGEGCLDAQTSAGKVAAVVARKAREAGASVVAVVGRCSDDADVKSFDLVIDSSRYAIFKTLTAYEARRRLELAVESSWREIDILSR